MPKVEKGTLSTLHRNLLLVLDYSERRNGVGGFITGKAIARLLGGNWSDHRAKAMEQLWEWGWVEIYVPPFDRSRTRYYALTELARLDCNRSFAIPENETLVIDETEEKKLI